jgi:hypothetical protein
MAIASRKDLVQYALRKLGEPVIKVNVDAQQIDDRVNDAFQYWYDYHYDAVDRFFLKHLVTSTDMTNRYIDIGDPLIISINRCFPVNQSTINIFDLRYQIRLNDFYNFNNVSISQYVLARENLAMLDFFFTTEKQFRFNRHENRIYLDADWERDVIPGQYLVFDGLRCVDPAVYPDVYDDRFLKEYITELIREQWGENMKKFGNIALPGGVTLNGQQIFDEAQKNKTRLIHELKTEFQTPISFMMG